MTLGLALKYRPKRFAEVVGQTHVTTVLHRALQHGRLPRQLLFSGQSGLGKTTLARVVAAALLCENPAEGDACGHCPSCLDISSPSRTHPDVVEFDAASYGGKDQIKELASRASTAPIRGDWRVYIIDEAHGLTRDGGSAFLKLLEEPPSHVIFMLATTDPDKMLRTNRGRCVEFELLRPSDTQLADHLITVSAAEGWKLGDRTARAVLDATDPALGVRGVMMTLEKLSETLAWGTDPDPAEVEALLGVPPADVIVSLWTAVTNGDRIGALTHTDQLRTHISESRIRAALLAAAKHDLVDQLTRYGAAPVETWRYEQLATTPTTAALTDVLLCKLAEPRLAPNPDALNAYLQAAESVLEQLTTENRAAPAAADPHAHPAANTATSDAENPDDSGPVGPDLSDPVARFVTALTDSDPDTYHPMMGSGQIRFEPVDDDTVRVLYRGDAGAALLTQHRRWFLAAANAAGVVLTRAAESVAAIP